MINPKQSTRLVEKQLATAQKAAQTNKSHRTRLRLEIEALDRRIAEYQAFLSRR